MMKVHLIRFALGSGTSSSKPHSIEGAALITKLVGEKVIPMQT